MMNADLEPDDGYGQMLCDQVESYYVKPDHEQGGEWHVLTFLSGRQVQIYTEHPIVIVEPERH